MYFLNKTCRKLTLPSFSLSIIIVFLFIILFCLFILIFLHYASIAQFFFVLPSSSQGAKCLAKFIQNNPKLKHLILSHNRLRNPGIRYFLSSVKFGDKLGNTVSSRFHYYTVFSDLSVTHFLGPM